MNTRTLINSIAAASLFAGLATAALPDLSLVRVEASAEIKATPAAAWKALTGVEGQSAMGFKPDAPGQAVSEGKPVHGDCAGDKGNLVVTRSVKEKELRIYFDPDHGGYVCHTRIRLEPTAAGVRVTLSDWYSEEKADQKEKNRAASQQGMEQGIDAFKRLLESGKGK